MHSDTEESTVPESEHGVPNTAIDEALALVILYQRDEPWRVGEVAFLSPDGEAILGRGARADTGFRVIFGQQRPGSFSPSPPLATRAISRRQLRLSSRNKQSVIVENLGRAPLALNGEHVRAGECQPGDLVRVGSQMLLLCTMRSRPLLGDLPVPSFEFGLADSHGIVGESPAVWNLRSEIRTIARRSGHVLVSGPTGTGKELVAQAVHDLSGVSRELVARNAATLPETLIDAELFGNARNYPNPGMADRPGLIGEAHESSLFLDEIAELPVASQARLLRVLDEGEYQRLGESRSRASRFRLIAATNRDPKSLKEDLGARFTLRVTVPDLNARREDIPLITREILRIEARRGDALALRLFPGGDIGAHPELPLEAVERLVRRSYSAHVRELRRLVLGETAGAPEVDSERAISRASESPPPQDDVGLAPSAIQRCLDEHNGSIDATWRALGLSSRFVLNRLLKKHGLQVRRRLARGRD